MTEVENKTTNGTCNAKTTKKRKGFWFNLFSRSFKTSEVDEKRDEEKKDDQLEEPKRKGGFTNMIMDGARQMATHEAEHIAEDEARKEFDALWNNNNNGSTNTTNTSGVPDTTTTTSPSDALSASTNWAKRMADSAQQKVQGLQNLTS